MMRRVVLFAVLAISASLALPEDAFAGRGGCGGGGGRCGHRGRGGCGGGGCGGGYCGGGYGGCGFGGGCGGGYCGGAVCATASCAVDAGATASVTLDLPEGAVVTVNGQQIANVGGRQTFRTPAIEANSDYHYVVRIQLTRDGQTTDVTRVVPIRAGQESLVSLEGPETTTVATE
jgi:uncharacterized protein (TIGR03000 family)